MTIYPKALALGVAMIAMSAPGFAQQVDADIETDVSGAPAEALAVAGARGDNRAIREGAGAVADLRAERANASEVRGNSATARENAALARQDTTAARENAAAIRQDASTIREIASTSRGDTAAIRDQVQTVRDIASANRGRR